MIRSRNLADGLPIAPTERKGWPWRDHAIELPLLERKHSEWPRISIVAPSYNQGSFIEETIRSVLMQGYPNLELIVIDGGSKDNTLDVIEKYKPYISYFVSERDNGQAHAINKGLAHATGDILGWLNTDDRYVRGAFKRVARAFKKNPDSIAVHGDRIMIDENGDVFGWTCLPPFDPQNGEYTICSETFFWRRSALKTVGMLREDLRFAMDLEYFCRLYKSGKLTKLNRFLGYFRCHPNNKSSTMLDVGREEATREWRRLFGCDAAEVHEEIDEGLLRKARMVQALLGNPRLVAWPYFVRRVFRGQRGMLATVATASK